MARDLTQALVGIDHRAVGADQRHAVGQPIECLAQGMSRRAIAAQPLRDVMGLLQMRQQPLHQADFAALNMPPDLCTATTVNSSGPCTNVAARE
jgi:hypothetical protein